jgi:hemerythrin superfamily protein
MSTDAIVVLKQDHKEVKRLFRAFEKAAKTGTPAQRGALVTSIIAELTKHTYIENEIMYPEVRTLLPDLEDDVLESYEEHHVADVLCLELSQLSPDDDHFVAKTTVLIENVEHHVKEEEEDWFPKVREGLSRTQLQEIGARLLAAKETAPTSPSDPKAKKSAHDALTA